MSEEYQTVHIPVSEIYSDENFNCRGIIPPADVLDLAQDIQKNNLQFPIAVQPASDVGTSMPEGKKFRIVAGHRRFKAWSVLHKGWSPGDPAPGGKPCDNNPFATIPVMVKSGLSEVQARILNLGENLKRKDLNIMQEARAIEHLQAAGIPRDHVADELGMSSGWVQTRYYLLELPDEIQKEAAAGLINQLQIKQLYSLRNDKDKQFEAVRQIKDAKAKGEKVGHIGKRQKQKTNVKKERKRAEMFKMIDLMAKSVNYGLHTRTLSWCAGEISTEELFIDIKRYCEERQLPAPRLPNEF